MRFCWLVSFCIGCLVVYVVGVLVGLCCLCWCFVYCVGFLDLLVLLLIVAYVILYAITLCWVCLGMFVVLEVGGLRWLNAFVWV